MDDIADDVITYMPQCVNLTVWHIKREQDEEEILVF